MKVLEKAKKWCKDHKVEIATTMYGVGCMIFGGIVTMAIGAWADSKDSTEEPELDDAWARQMQNHVDWILAGQPEGVYSNLAYRIDEDDNGEDALWDEVKTKGTMTMDNGERYKIYGGIYIGKQIED